MKVDPIDLTQGSVRCASVTPAEGGAIELLIETLQNAGFAWHRADRGRIASFVAAAIHLSKSLLAGTAILDRMEVEGEAMSVYLVGGPTCPDEMDHLASQTLDEGSDHFDASTTCSTSGARFVKDHCPVVEFGQIGKTMHQVDERVEVAQIPVLASIYRRILTEYFA